MVSSWREATGGYGEDEIVAMSEMPRESVECVEGREVLVGAGFIMKYERGRGKSHQTVGDPKKALPKKLKEECNQESFSNFSSLMVFKAVDSVLYMC